MLNNSQIANIDFKALDEKINAFIDSPDREVELVIAEGTLPGRGKDRSLIPHITKLDEAEALLLRKKLLHAVEKAREQPQMIYDKDFPLSEAQSLSAVAKHDLLYEFSKSELAARIFMGILFRAYRAMILLCLIYGISHKQTTN